MDLVSRSRLRLSPRARLGEPRDRPLRRAARSFARVILFDRRGTGLSDPLPGPATLEERMDDVRAVMDAAGSERAALIGVSEGGPMCMLFAATYPERTLGPGPLRRDGADRPGAEDYPWAPTRRRCGGARRS